MELKYNELMESLKKGINEKIYLFLGKESFLKAKALDKIKKNIFQNSDPGMNFERFSASQAQEVDTAINTSRTMPFLARGRMIILDDIHKADKKSLVLISKLSPKDIPDNCAFIMVSDQQSLDKRKKEIKLLLQKSCTTVFWPLFENQIPDFIRDELKIYNKSITPEGVRKMLLLTGKELNVIASELLKLSLYTGTKPTIDENDVEIIVDDYTEANIFSVIDHILSGQIDKAAKEWEQNLLSGTPASEAAIVKMLSDAFRAALQAAETASLPGEYRNMLSLSREFSALASKSDFRSNQRKKEIKIQVSRLYSKKAAQENGYSNLQGAAMSIFEKSESRVLMAFITADTYKTNGIAPMIEYLWEAEKTIKMGTGVKDTAVPILLGKSLDLLKKIRQGH